jgi:uncharacterized protein
VSVVTAKPKAPLFASVRSVLAAHPFVWFFVIAYAGSWVCLAPMVLGQDGLGLLPYSVPFMLYVGLFLAASFTGPTLAAVVVTAALAGRQGLKQFFRRYIQWRVGLPWYLLVFFGFPAIYLLSATIWMGTAALQAVVQQWPTFFTGYLMAMLIFPGILQWGEEPGWRGFAQTRMQRPYGPLRASLIVGFLHGVWHLPNHLLVVGPPAAGPFNPVNFAINVAIIMIVTLLFTWIFNGGLQSILVAVLVHASFNASQQWMGSVLPDQPQQVGYTALAIIAVCAIAVAILTRGKLGYDPSRDAGAADL